MRMEAKSESTARRAHIASWMFALTLAILVALALSACALAQDASWKDDYAGISDSLTELEEKWAVTAGDGETDPDHVDVPEKLAE